MTRLLPALLATAALGSGCVVHTSGSVRTTVAAPATTSYQVQADAYAAPTYVTVAEPPPPLHETTTQGSKPDPNATWVTGHWRWEGRWVWQPGRWRVARPGYVWEPPVVVGVATGGYQYHPGYWREDSVAPPPIYRTRGTIRVHVTRPGAQPPVERVVVTANRPPETSVVVRGTAATGSSRTVVVGVPGAGTTTRTTTTVRGTPGNTTTVRGSNTTRTTTTVRGQTGTSTTVRGNDTTRTTTTVRGQRGTTTTVRGDDGTTRTTTTVRGNGGTTTTVRGNGNRGTTTTTVRGSRDTTTGGTTTTTVRGSRDTTTGGTRVNTTRPARDTASGGTRVNTTRPARDTASGGTRAVTSTARPANDTTSGGTRVNTTRPARDTATVTSPRNPTPTRPSMGVTVTRPAAGPNPGSRPSCRPTVTAVPRNGFVVLRGTNLENTTAVNIGGSAAAITRKTATEVRVRMSGNGGRVRITVGGQSYACGTVRAAGR